MKTKAVIIMLVVLTATSGCSAAPSIRETDTLKRPSPINPAIPMDPKPAEKVTVITDPKEIAKIKREVVGSGSVYTITAPTTLRPQKNSAEQSHQEQHTPVPAPVAIDQAKHRQKRAESVGVSTQPLIYRDQHKLPVSQLSESDITAKPQTLPAPIPPPEHQTEKNDLTPQNEKAPSFQIYFDAGKRSEMKRDIPVPLVPKYHHPDESPNEEAEKHDENQKSSDSKNENLSTTTTSTTSTSTTAKTTTTHP